MHAQPKGRTAGCTYLVRSPSAFAMTPTELPNAPYTSDIVANGAVLQYWRQVSETRLISPRLVLHGMWL